MNELQFAYKKKKGKQRERSREATSGCYVESTLVGKLNGGGGGGNRLSSSMSRPLI